jgi:DNA repair protein RecO (recombination protein O)
MEWRDDGFVLATRRHGESALIVELLTGEHGRHAGLVRGGQSPRRRALLQPGNRVTAAWRGRLPEHLGTFDCELITAYAAPLLDDPDRLAALNAALALLLAALPEREPQPEIYAAVGGLLTALSSGFSGSDARALPLDGGGLGGGGRAGKYGQSAYRTASSPPQPSPIQGEGGKGDSGLDWAVVYVAWECVLLASLGFGLDLTRCAATGSAHDLAYVSPRSGRAVSREAGRPYHDKLLPLPGFLWREAAPATAEDIVDGLATTRHFLLHHLFEPQGGRLPEARELLAERMRRHTAIGIIERL